MKSFLIAIACVIFIYQAVTVLGQRPYRQQLRKHLESKKSPYNMMIPPDEHNITVTSHLTIICIFGLSDKEVLNFSAWMTLSWKDPRFRWNSSDWHGISILEMEVNGMWFPDVGIWNAKEPNFADLRQMLPRTLIIKENGVVSAYLPISASIPCPIKVDHFPFDHQVCRIILGTVSSPRRYIRLDVTSVDLERAKKTSIGGWTPLDYEITKYSRYYEGVNDYFDFFYVDIILQRKSLYYILLVIIPFVLLTSTAVMIFFLHRVGDRTAMSIAVILPMSVYVVITSQDAPKSMLITPLLCEYILIQMCLLIVFTFIAVFCAAAPHMEKESNMTVMKKILQFMINNRRRFDFFCFVTYLLITLVVSCICLLIFPFTHQN